MPASAGDNQISITSLVQGFPEGAVLNFPNGKCVLTAAASAGATTLSVVPIDFAIDSNSTGLWYGEVMIGVETYTYIPLSEPLKSAIPDGSVISFDGLNVTLAQEASSGTLYLIAHPTAQPPPGTESIYSAELISPPYIRKLLTIGGMRTGGSTRHYPYSLKADPLVTIGGMRTGGTTTRVIRSSGGMRTGGTTAFTNPRLRSIGGLRTGGTTQRGHLYSFGGMRTGGSTELSSAPAPVLLGSNGMTQLVSGNADDANVNVGDVGFDFPFYDAIYRNNIHVGSNSYITFGFGSSAYSGLTVSNPGRGLFVSSADRSYQQVFVKADAPNRFRIRYEGSTGTSGSPGSPTMLWEATLFTNGNIQLVTGVLGNADGANFITNGTEHFTNIPFAPHSSYLIARVSSNQYTL